MSVTGVYFVPANPNASTALQTILEHLRTAYQPVPAGRWVLEHKLLRDTPSCLPPSAYAPLSQLQPRFMQLLSLSRFQSHGFICISNRPDPDPWNNAMTGTNGPSSSRATPVHNPQREASTVSGTPQQQQQQQQQHAETQLPTVDWTMTTLDPSSFGSFLSITLRACEPLWSLRHTVTATGTSFSVSDFHIRLADVRQTHPTNRIRGTVVEIEYRGPNASSTPAAAASAAASLLSVAAAPVVLEGNAEDNNILAPPPSSSAAARQLEGPLPTDEDWRIGAMLIREFWSRIAVPGAREAILVPGVGTESRNAIKRGKRRLTTDEAGVGHDGIAGVDLARQYMEAFRFNR